MFEHESVYSSALETSSSSFPSFVCSLTHSLTHARSFVRLFIRSLFLFVSRWYQIYIQWSSFGSIYRTETEREYLTECSMREHRRGQKKKEERLQTRQKWSESNVMTSVARYPNSIHMHGPPFFHSLHLFSYLYPMRFDCFSLPNCFSSSRGIQLEKVTFFLFIQLVFNRFRTIIRFLDFVW